MRELGSISSDPPDISPSIISPELLLYLIARTESSVASNIVIYAVYPVLLNRIIS